MKKLEENSTSAKPALEYGEKIVATLDQGGVAA
jgi:hypothetical protein